EQGKVRVMGEDISRLKQSEALLQTKPVEASSDLSRQLEEMKKKHEEELSAKIMEGVKEYVSIRKAMDSTKNVGSGTTPYAV
ncbi:hypothetical protein MKX03_036511, partial [Papaver bracteatum]